MSNSILSAIADLQRHNFEVQVVDIHRLIVTLHGPSNSVYRNGVWKVGIKLPENFPNNPPLLVRFLNQIFHPNIEWETGNVCLDVLSQCWNRESNLYQIFEHYLPELLCKPFPIDPFNVRAANMYLQNLEEFEAVAIEHKNNFALEHHIRDLDFGDFDDYSLPVNPA